MATANKKTVKKRVVKVEAEGYAYIKATFNNIIISYTNKGGQVISWSSVVNAVSRVLRKALRMQLRWQHRMQDKRLMKQV